MQSKDFEGLFKYKLIIPVVTTINIVLVVVGPLFIGRIYQIIALVFFSIATYKIIVGFCTMIVAIRKSQAIFRKISKKQYDKILPSRQREQIYFGFIIANYKEQLEVLCDTLEMLAKQKRAKNRYLIFLAMQKGEEGSDAKAKQLQQKFKNKFRAIQYTVHVLQPNQQAGKAANASWCAQNLQPFLQKHNIQQEKLFLTIIDADSWAPEAYFQEVQQDLIDHPEQKYLSIYQPPQIYTRNNLQVPIISRTIDLFLSYYHTSTLLSFFNYTFSLSNYTLSYSLLKRIGFWDKCPDAIGEDFHMVQKAFWKTDGQVIAKPIYTAFNQLNIQTGNGYLQNIKARFWQQQRHGQGCADFAYCLKQFFESKFKFRNLVFLTATMQNYIIQAVSPFPAFASFLSSLIPKQYLDPDTSSDLIFIFFILFNVGAVFNIGVGLLNDFYRRRNNEVLYGQQNESLIRVLQFQILNGPLLITFILPAVTIASFRVLKNDRTYDRAQKKSLLSSFKIQDEQNDSLANDSI